MKHKPEPIVEYLKAIGCRPLRNPNQVKAFLDEELGDAAQSTFDTFASFNNGRAMRSTDAAGGTEFYNWKNESFDRSRTLSFIYEWNVLRDLGRTLQNFNDKIGKSVLDLGCENGLLTCFLARLCPDSRILAVDRCAAAVANSRKLASDLGLTNVEFSVGDAASLGDRSFDTVFASRVAHENFEEGTSLCYPRHLNEIGQIEAIRGLHADFAKSVARLVQEAGNLIAISRLPFNVSYCGRMLSLVDNALVWQKALWREVQSEPGPLDTEGSPHFFQVAVLERGKQTEAGLLGEFHAVCNEKIPADQSVWYNDNARWMMLWNSGTLIEGVRLCDDETGEMCGDFAVYTDKVDAEHIWVLRDNTPDDILTERMSRDMLDAVVKAMKEWRSNSLATGGMVAQDMEAIPRNPERV